MHSSALRCAFHSADWLLIMSWSGQVSVATCAHLFALPALVVRALKFAIGTCLMPGACVVALLALPHSLFATLCVPRVGHGRFNGGGTWLARRMRLIVCYTSVSSDLCGILCLQVVVADRLCTVIMMLAAVPCVQSPAEYCASARCGGGFAWCVGNAVRAVQAVVARVTYVWLYLHSMGR